MNEVFGLPAHPLLVHVPVVLLPLALVGVVVILVRPQWKSALLVPTGVIGAAGAIGAILASQTGEWLQQRVPETALIGQHQELGEMARNFSILFAGALFVWVVRELLIDRGILGETSFGEFLTPLLSPKWIGTAAAAAALVFGTLTTVWVVRAGHTGAKAAWKGRVSDAPRDIGDR